MGEVYEAEDLRLGRHVALKVVSASCQQSPTAFQRFEREARAASALNHPHICTIYDLLEHAGQPVIVMELLDGRSLAQIIEAGAIDERRFLHLARQMTEGLDAAHRAGVVHRDITPANIFVTGHGDVKILDFGLAKLAATTTANAATDAETHIEDRAGLTGVGQMVGTVAYMSPEQVRGESLDARTDLFSCGAVLYEMATGRRPFEGRTSAMVCDSILHSTPAPLHRTNSRLPMGLQPIIDKALEKDRDLRYQSAADVKADLMRLERGSAIDGGGEPRRRSPWIAAIGVGVVAGFLLVYSSWRTAVPSGVTPDSEALTDGPGVETDPAVSPDGRFVAYTSDEGGNRDVWIVELAKDRRRPRRMTTDAAQEEHPSWFPNSESLVFQSDRDGTPGVWRLALDGSAPPELVIRDARTPALSADGRKLAFTRRRAGGFLRIAIADLADTSRVTFLTGEADGVWDHRQPAWSRDGNWICYQATDGLWVVGTDGRNTRRLVSIPDRVMDPAWAPDGQAIYYSGLINGRHALWRVSVGGGTPSRVTIGSGIERSPTVSADGRVLVFSTELVSRHLSFVDLETRKEAEWEASSRDESYPALAQDGSAVYFVSNRHGGAGIWRQPLSAGTPVGDAVQVTNQGGDVSFVDVSADGQWLAFVLMTGARREIWVAPTDPDNGAPSRLSDTTMQATHPAWSPDGGRVAYVMGREGDQQVWIQPVSGRRGGRAVVLTTSLGYKRWPAWIDANRLAFVAQGPTGLAELVESDLTRQSVNRWITSGADAVRARYRPEIGTLLVSGPWGASAGRFEVRGIDLDGKPRPFVPLDLGTDVLSLFFDVSRDGRTLVFSRGASSGDVWALRAQDGRRY